MNSLSNEPIPTSPVSPQVLVNRPRKDKTAWEILDFIIRSGYFKAFSNYEMDRRKGFDHEELRAMYPAATEELFENFRILYSAFRI
jgi:hypothetical protein